jgi:hypothetical protein
MSIEHQNITHEVIPLTIEQLKQNIDKLKEVLSSIAKNKELAADSNDLRMTIQNLELRLRAMQN